MSIAIPDIPLATRSQGGKAASDLRILVRGAGVAGLATAFALAERGFQVEVAERADAIGLGASHFAGGMLAPWCEGETADRSVVAAGAFAIDWWDAALPGLVIRKGTLVVASPRDAGEIERFASRTSQFERVDADGIAALEPALAGRFRHGLYFAREAHVDPRAALAGLYQRLMARGVRFHFGAADLPGTGFTHGVDCTGRAAIGEGSALRGVRGEMAYLRTSDIALSRPVRLLHPRIPLYVSPQPGNRFMVGATMIESAHDGPVSARSLMELLNAAYALHPAFGEAEVIETGTGIRPAYADNRPRLTGAGSSFAVNGLYRHGFLMAPRLAEDLAERLSMECLEKEALS